MVEYIEREALISKIVNTPFTVNCSGETSDYSDGVLCGLVKKQNQVIDLIQAMPAADVVPKTKYDMAINTLRAHGICFEEEIC